MKDHFRYSDKALGRPKIEEIQVVSARLNSDHTNGYVNWDIGL